MGRAQRNPSVSLLQLIGFAALYPSCEACVEILWAASRLIEGEAMKKGLTIAVLVVVVLLVIWQVLGSL